MGVIAKGIPRGCQGLFTPVSLGYPLSVFNKNSTLKKREISKESARGSWLREANVWVSAKGAPHDGQDTVKTLQTIKNVNKSVVIEQVPN